MVANQTTDELKAINIKGTPYVEVNERVRYFRNKYPNWSIETELLSLDNGVCVIKAIVKDENGNTKATGHAYEKEDSTFINQTSYIENCETSAVGRALGLMGIGIDKSIASKEEVENAILNQDKVRQIKPATELKCSVCGEKISSQVHKFSMEKYKKPLCMNCQNKNK